MTFLELFVFSSLALVERHIEREPLFVHKADLNTHSLVAFFMTLSRGLTNLSLAYLNYPTQVIFKSMKLLSNMIGSMFINDRKYSTFEYLSAGNIIMSAVLFCLGDSDVSPRYTKVGLVIVISSLAFDSLHANYQEKLIRVYGATELEVSFYPNAISCLFIFTWCFLTGELVSAIAFCTEHIEAPLLLFFRGLALYLGARTYIACVNAFDTYTATSMTTIRKVVTVLLSFLLVPKPFTSKYVMGGAFFVAGLYFGLQKKSSPPQSSPPNAGAATTSNTPGESVELTTLQKHSKEKGEEQQ